MIKKIICIIMLFQTVLIGNESMMEKEAFILNLPKAELHLHLGGSYPKEYLFSIANPEQRRVLQERLDAFLKGVDYHEGFQVFQLISQLVNTEEKVQKGVEALCLSLQQDGVTYAEIRTNLKDLGKGYEEYLKAILRGIDAVSSETFTATVLLSMQRSSTPSVAERTIQMALKYHKQGVVGLDISGDSTIGEIDAILPQLMHAKEAGLPFVVHVGESLKERDQLSLLQALCPVRVGHGVYLTQDAKEWILENKVPLEVCLTSSVLVQMIGHYHEHPGFGFYRLGHPISFCTDDPLIFSTTLSKELLHAHELGGLSLSDIEKITKDSFKQAL